MQLRIREMRREDAEGVLGVYRRFAREYVGLASRDIKAYRRLLRTKENVGWVALDQKGDMLGYVAARFDKRAREARIREIVVDPSVDFEQVAKLLVSEACKSLLEKKPAVISAGSIRNPVYAKIFPEHGFFDVESTGVFMYAILDVPKFLREISSILANRLERLKQWEGLFQLRCEEHGLFLRKQGESVEALVWTNEEPDFQIVLSRDVLIKLLFGVVDSVDLFRGGQLKVETGLKEKEASRVLAAVFPRKRFLIMDFW